MLSNTAVSHSCSGSSSDYREAHSIIRALVKALGEPEAEDLVTHITAAMFHHRIKVIGTLY